MKKLVTFFIGLLFSFAGFSQSCLPDGITFSTQSQIDSFQINYPNCTEIEGDVNIGDYGGGSNINILSGLSVLVKIKGHLAILYNDSLSSLSGLDNLTAIGNYLSIEGNSMLTSLTGLSNLTEIGHYLIICCNSSLTSLTGLEGITSIEEVNIGSNFSLNTLMGIENLTAIGNDLYIYNNPALSSVTGLVGLTTIGGFISLGNNNSLTSLTGLENLISIGGSFHIYHNPTLTSLSGLINLSSIGGDLSIYDHEELTSLEGLDNIDAGSIDSLSIVNNPALSFCEVQSICDFLASPNGPSIIVANDAGCNSYEEVAEACSAGLLDMKTIENQYHIYPNPAYSQITIETSALNLKSQLSIFNINGQQVIYNQTAERLKVIDITDWAQGIYYVKLTNDNDVAVFKLVKN